jgi:two-component system sensor histidine kinase YesM
MIQQTKENEIEELSVMADSLGESISVIEEVSKRFYFDDGLEHIAFHTYENYEEILSDYREYETVSEYQRNYYQEISGITVYMYNPTISDNEHFVYADAATKSSNWYIETVNLAGSPYWGYQYDSLTQKNNLRLSRVLYTRDREKVGVLSIVMQNKRSELLISEREESTMLLYDDVMVVHSNCTDVDYDEIFSCLMKNEGESFSVRTTLDGEDYLVSAVRIVPDYSEDYYTMVSIRPYKEILWVATRAAFGNVIPMLVCVLIALALIFVFSNSISARVNMFRVQMHKAANGDFKIAERLEGGDEIAELYRDLNAMIRDIQELLERIVQEQVQKEQLNTRQKEVEFKMLASQINPHFLYNTLETIRMQARVRKQPEIEELAKMLAKIMRHNIQVGDSLQPVKEEIKLVRYYLKIQDYRFHDRIHYEILVDDEKINHLLMMPLVMQPYVENAFVHGLEGKERDGLIRIEISVSARLWITITDNGCGMSEEKLEEVRKNLNDFENLDRTHIGICNVNQRIKLQYGNDYGVTIDSTEGQGTCVTIQLPIIM